MSLQNNLLPPIENATLSEKVYDLLREQIIQRTLLPGEKLDIHALAKMLRISRTPIKEAFNRLSTEGLITIYPHRGTYIRNVMGPRQVEELFGVRLMMEFWGLEAVINDPNSLNLERMVDILRQCDCLFSSPDTFDYMTFFRYDHEFHTVIVDAAKNSRLSEMYESLAVHILILRTYWGQPRDRALKSHEEHHHILEGFRQNSPDVKRRLANHIERSKKLMLALGTAETRSDGTVPTNPILTVTTPS